MKTVRLAVSFVCALLVGGGYFASQFAYFFGDPSQYKRALDNSSVPFLALGVLIAAVLLLVLPSEEKVK